MLTPEQKHIIAVATRFLVADIAKHGLGSDTYAARTAVRNAKAIVRFAQKPEDEL
jgi:hypothetical protein